MTNTLVVENHKKWLPGEEMYLSGPPLHVLAMHCVERWRAAFGGAVPLSFSGGIDQHNFVDAVACDFVPVTTCTDLLRPGGYGRLRQVSRQPGRGDGRVRRARSRRAHLQALRQGRRGGAAGRRRASKRRARPSTRASGARASCAWRACSTATRWPRASPAIRATRPARTASRRARSARRWCCSTACRATSACRSARTTPTSPSTRRPRRWRTRTSSSTRRAR